MQKTKAISTGISRRLTICRFVAEHKVMQKSVDEIKSRVEEMIQSEVEGDVDWVREVMNLVGGVQNAS
jgi:chorismate mutase